MPDLLAFVRAVDDEDIRALVVACLVASCRLSPGSNGMTTAGGLALTTTVRVVDRVHGDTAVGRTNSLPAIAACLADRNVLVIGVAHLANRCHALDQHLAGFARGQLEKRVI